MYYPGPVSKQKYDQTEDLPPGVVLAFFNVVGPVYFTFSGTFMVACASTNPAGWVAIGVGASAGAISFLAFSGLSASYATYWSLKQIYKNRDDLALHLREEISALFSMHKKEPITDIKRKKVLKDFNLFVNKSTNAEKVLFLSAIIRLLAIEETLKDDKSKNLVKSLFSKQCLSNHLSSIEDYLKKDSNEFSSCRLEAILVGALAYSIKSFEIRKRTQNTSDIPPKFPIKLILCHDMSVRISCPQQDQNALQSIMKSADLTLVKSRATKKNIIKVFKSIVEDYDLSKQSQHRDIINLLRTEGIPQIETLNEVIQILDAIGIGQGYADKAHPTRGDSGSSKKLSLLRYRTFRYGLFYAYSEQGYRETNDTVLLAVDLFHKAAEIMYEMYQHKQLDKNQYKTYFHSIFKRRIDRDGKGIYLSDRKETTDVPYRQFNTLSKFTKHMNCVHALKP